MKKYIAPCGICLALVLLSARGQQVINAVRDWIDISTPTAPASGKTRVYTKSGTLCAESPGGSETCTGVVSGLAASGFYLNSGSNYYIPTTMFLATLPSSGAYAWVNQGSATETATGNGLVLYAPSNSGTGLRIRTAVISSFTTMTVAFICNSTPLNYGSCAAGFRESATGKVTWFQYAISTGSPILSINCYSNPTTFSSTPYAGGQIGLPQVIWLQVQVSGSNLLYSYSKDGTNYIQAYSQAKTACFTTAPDQWFYGADQENSSGVTYMTLLHWKTQ